MQASQWSQVRSARPSPQASASFATQVVLWQKAWKSAGAQFSAQAA
jgi:hypothetical protein